MRGKYFLASVFFLLLGISIYFLFRNTDMLLFDWFENMRWLNRVYFPLDTKGNVAVSFLVYTVPDGFWLLSGILFIRWIWYKNSRWNETYAGVFYGMAILFEIIQMFEGIPGTFDFCDLFFMVFCAFLEGIMYKRFIMRRKFLSKQKCGPHIATIAALVVFVVLGLACASAPSSYSSGSGSSSSSSGCQAKGTCFFAGSTELGGAYIWCEDPNCAVAYKAYSTCDC